MRTPGRLAVGLLVVALSGCTARRDGSGGSGAQAGTPGATFSVSVRGDAYSRSSPTADPVYLVTGGRVESGRVTATGFVPDGKIDCGLIGATRYPACTADYPWGTTGLVLRATPDVAKGITYAGFAGACSSEGTCALQGNADKMVLVRFLVHRIGHANFSPDGSDGAWRVHAQAYADAVRGAPGSFRCDGCHGPKLEGRGTALGCNGCHTWQFDWNSGSRLLTTTWTQPKIPFPWVRGHARTGQLYWTGCTSVAVGQLINYYFQQGFREIWLAELLHDTWVYPRVQTADSGWSPDMVTTWRTGYVTDPSYPDAFSGGSVNTEDDWRLEELLWNVALGLDSVFTASGTSPHVPLLRSLFTDGPYAPLLRDRFRFSAAMDPVSVSRLDDQSDYIVGSLEDRRPVLITMKDSNRHEGHAVLIDAFWRSADGRLFLKLNFGWGNEFLENDLLFPADSPIRVGDFRFDSFTIYREARPDPGFLVSVSVSGLAGAGLQLAGTIGAGAPRSLDVSADGSVAFPSRGLPGSGYLVTVSSQPSNPTQLCEVANGSGVIGSADVTVTVTCTTPPPPDPAVTATRLTTNAAPDLAPRWTADGEIVFQSSRTNTRANAGDVWRMAADGTNQRELVHVSISTPTTWGDSGLAGGVVVLGNGDLLVLETQDFHEFMRVATSTATTLPIVRVYQDGNDASFTRILFVPGGQSAGYLTYAATSGKVVWLANAGGAAQIRTAPLAGLTGQSTDSYGTLLRSVTGGTVEGLSLSPDGTRLVASICSASCWAGRGPDLFILDAATGAVLQQLTTSGASGVRSQFPSWSPRGDWIAFSDDDGTTQHLWLASVSGTPTLRQLDLGVRASWPAWSSDGRSLAFVGTGADGNQDVWVARDVVAAAPPPPASPGLGAAEALSTVPRGGDWCWFGGMDRAVQTSGGVIRVASGEHRACDTFFDRLVVHERAAAGAWSSAVPFTYDYSAARPTEPWYRGIPGTVAGALDASGAMHLVVQNDRSASAGYPYSGALVYAWRSATGWQGAETTVSDGPIQVASGNASGSSYAGMSAALAHDPATGLLRTIGHDGAWFATAYHVVTSTATPGVAASWAPLQIVATSGGAVDRGAILGEAQDYTASQGVQVWVDGPTCRLKGRELVGGAWAATIDVPLGYARCTYQSASSYGFLAHADVVATGGDLEVLLFARSVTSSAPVDLLRLSRRGGVWSSAVTTTTWPFTGWFIGKTLVDGSGKLRALHLTAGGALAVQDLTTGTDLVLRTPAAGTTIEDADCALRLPEAVAWTEKSSADLTLYAAPLTGFATP